MSKKSNKSDVQDAPKPISRDDIEARFRQLTGDVNDTAQKMSKAAVASGAVALIILLILVFVVGRNKGQKKTTVIEIVRV